MARRTGVVPSRRMILLWQNSRLPRRQSMRVALLGGGTIARLVLQHVRGGDVPGVEIVALAGRNGSSRGRALAREFGVSYVAGRAALVAARPTALKGAASPNALLHTTPRALAQ